MMTLKKFTPHNLFAKWPKIIFWRVYEKFLRNSFFRNIVFLNKPIILTDDYGMRFILYPWTHEPLEKLVTRRHLKGEYEAISKIIKTGDVVIDVGANVGTHTVYMSKIVGEFGRIYAFEPVEETFWNLKENLTLNKVENVEVVESALKEKDGTENMHIFPSDFSEWNSFGIPETNESKPERIMEVKIMKLDTFAKSKNIKRINFLKIDVEGSEKYVLKGADNFLKQGLIDTISFEISSAPLKGMGGSAKEIFDILNNYDYEVYEYDAKMKKFIGPFTDSSEQYKNYYASKADLRKL